MASTPLSTLASPSSTLSSPSTLSSSSSSTTSSSTSSSSLSTISSSSRTSSSSSSSSSSRYSSSTSTTTSSSINNNNNQNSSSSSSSPEVELGASYLHRRLDKNDNDNNVIADSRRHNNHPTVGIAGIPTLPYTFPRSIAPPLLPLVEETEPIVVDDSVVGEGGYSSSSKAPFNNNHRSSNIHNILFRQDRDEDKKQSNNNSDENSEQFVSLTSQLPPGPLGVAIQKSGTDGTCVVIAKKKEEDHDNNNEEATSSTSSGSSTDMLSLQVGDVIESLNGTHLTNMEGGTWGMVNLIAASAEKTRTVVVRRRKRNTKRRRVNSGDESLNFVTAADVSIDGNDVVEEDIEIISQDIPSTTSAPEPSLAKDDSSLDYDSSSSYADFLDTILNPSSPSSSSGESSPCSSQSSAVVDDAESSSLTSKNDNSNRSSSLENCNNNDTKNSDDGAVLAQGDDERELIHDVDGNNNFGSAKDSDNFNNNIGGNDTTTALEKGGESDASNIIAYVDDGNGDNSGMNDANSDTNRRTALLENSNSLTAANVASTQTTTTAANNGDAMLLSASSSPSLDETSQTSSVDNDTMGGGDDNNSRPLSPRFAAFLAFLTGCSNNAEMGDKVAEDEAASKKDVIVTCDEVELIPETDDSIDNNTAETDPISSGAKGIESGEEAQSVNPTMSSDLHIDGHKPCEEMVAENDVDDGLIEETTKAQDKGAELSVKAQQQLLTFELPPGPVGVNIQRMDIDGTCLVISKANGASPLEVGDVIKSLNEMELVDIMDEESEGSSVATWLRIFETSVDSTRIVVVRREVSAINSAPPDSANADAKEATETIARAEGDVSESKEQQQLPDQKVKIEMSRTATSSLPDSLEEMEEGKASSADTWSHSEEDPSDNQTVELARAKEVKLQQPTSLKDNTQEANEENEDGHQVKTLSLFLFAILVVIVLAVLYSRKSEDDPASGDGDIGSDGEAINTNNDTLSPSAAPSILAVV